MFRRVRLSCTVRWHLFTLLSAAAPLQAALLLTHRRCSISGTGLRRFTIVEASLHTRAGAARLPGLKPLYYFSQMFGTFAQPNWSGMASTSTISTSWRRSCLARLEPPRSWTNRRGRRRRTRHSFDLFLLYGFTLSLQITYLCSLPVPCCSHTPCLLCGQCHGGGVWGRELGGLNLAARETGGEREQSKA